jgi:cytochrome c oxidase subunit III
MIQATQNNFQMKAQTEPGVNPKKFLLWLLIAASVMLFAGLTSAYIVRRGEGNWLVFDLPVAFAFNVGVVILSSILMQLSFLSAKKDELNRTKSLLIATLVSGILFLVGQFNGWGELVDNNLYLAGNPAESFIYVIPALHFLHVLIGIVFIAVVVIKAYRFNVHKKNMISIYLCTTYWHFVGALWIYLYFFFLLNR